MDRQTDGQMFGHFTANRQMDRQTDGQTEFANFNIDLNKTRLFEPILTNFIAKKCCRFHLDNFLLQKIAKNGSFFPPTCLFHPTRLLDTLEYKEP